MDCLIRNLPRAHTMHFAHTITTKNQMKVVLPSQVVKYTCNKENCTSVCSSTYVWISTLNVNGYVHKNVHQEAKCILIKLLVNLVIYFGIYRSDYSHQIGGRSTIAYNRHLSGFVHIKFQFKMVSMNWLNGVHIRIGNNVCNKIPHALTAFRYINNIPTIGVISWQMRFDIA